MNANEPSVPFKILYCDPEMGGCGDMVRLYGSTRRCHCSLRVGRFNTDAFSIISGPCRVIGLSEGESVNGLPRGVWREDLRRQRVDHPSEVEVDRFEMRRLASNRNMVR